jgi:proline racemase
MDSAGFVDLSVHGAMAAVAIAAAHGLLTPLGAGVEICCDTAADTLHVRVLDRTDDGGRIVAVRGTTARAGSGGLVVDLGGRRLRADVAFSSALCAVVDAESAGLALEPAHIQELRRVGEAVADAVERQHRPIDPLAPALQRIAATIFTGPARASSDLRMVAVRRRGSIDRAPGGESIAAVMAILHAMGLLGEGQTFTAEGLIGTTLTGRISSSDAGAGGAGIVADVEGVVWLTGEHTPLADDGDPFGTGFEV